MIKRLTKTERTPKAATKRPKTVEPAKVIQNIYLNPFSEPIKTAVPQPKRVKIAKRRNQARAKSYSHGSATPFGLAAGFRSPTITAGG